MSINNLHINEVLFVGSAYEQFPTATGYTTDAGKFRPGTVRQAFAGPLDITLPRKVTAPEILSISFSVTFPSGHASGWQGLKVLSLLEDGVEKYAVIMFDDFLAATTSSSTGGQMDEVIIAPGGGYLDRFGGAYSYSPPASYRYNIFNSPDQRFHPGVHCRRMYQVCWDMASSSNFGAGLYKADWWGGGGGISGSGLTALNTPPSSGINGIRLGRLNPAAIANPSSTNGALWAEIIVTAETQVHSVFIGSRGGHSLYLIDLPPNGAGSQTGWTGTYDTLDDIAPNLGFSGSDSIQTSTAGAVGSFAATNLPNPYGIVTDAGHPGEPWTNGYDGVQTDAFGSTTWTWEPFGAQVGAAGQTESTGEFSSTPSGPTNLKVGVVTNSSSAFSAAVTMPTYSPDQPFAYGKVFQLYEDNPVTGLQWTREELTALELAVKAEA
jgi:hypothetical protein